MKKLIVLLLFGLIGAVHAHAQDSPPQTTMFEIQAVDTMKYSRDAARNPSVEADIDKFVEAAALMKPTHIAIGTPYDEEFYPVLKKWVDAIRKKNISVWYRGNFAEWEGWFGRSRFKNPRDHIDLTRSFIYKHPELFEPGDIFTPAPEPENGAMGDPRMSPSAREGFFPFLIDSYNSCNEALRSIGKENVECGYFSTNGDVAELFTEEVVKQLGNVIVIDHYVRTPQELVDKIIHLHEKTGAQVVLGEYGAPIPDIHGDLTHQEQADLIRDNMIELMKHRDIVKGVNYWTAFGGSTTLFDGFSPRPGVDTVRTYFSPYVISGTVRDDIGNPVSGVTIGPRELPVSRTASDGTYTIVTTKDFPLITVEKDGYNSASFTPEFDPSVQHYAKDIIIVPRGQSLWYMIVKFFKSLFGQ